MHMHELVEAAYRTLMKGRDARATLGALEDYLHRRGLMKRYPETLRRLIARVKREEKRMTAQVILARDEDARSNHAAISKALQSLNVKEHEVVTDSSLIGGYIVKTKDLRVDHSYKNMLLGAYRRLTAGN